MYYEINFEYGRTGELRYKEQSQTIYGDAKFLAGAEGFCKTNFARILEVPPGPIKTNTKTQQSASKIHKMQVKQHNNTFYQIVVYCLGLITRKTIKQCKKLDKQNGTKLSK